MTDNRRKINLIDGIFHVNIAFNVIWWLCSVWGFENIYFWEVSIFCQEMEEMKFYVPKEIIINTISYGDVNSLGQRLCDIQFRTYIWVWNVQKNDIWGKLNGCQSTNPFSKNFGRRGILEFIQFLYVHGLLQHEMNTKELSFSVYSLKYIVEYSEFHYYR